MVLRLKGENLRILTNPESKNLSCTSKMAKWQYTTKTYNDKTRQCPTLGIQSFIRNGVRPALIPILMSFFEGRQMFVKWHGIMSSIRNFEGGGPQGSTIGIL